MSAPVQESLLDVGDAPAPGALCPERTRLARGAWIDVQRNWLAGAGELFARLAERVPWHAERRRMYDRTVDVPGCFASTRAVRIFQNRCSPPAVTCSATTTGPS